MSWDSPSCLFVLRRHPSFPMGWCFFLTLSLSKTRFSKSPSETAGWQRLSLDGDAAVDVPRARTDGRDCYVNFNSCFAKDLIQFWTRCWVKSVCPECSRWLTMLWDDRLEFAQLWLKAELGCLVCNTSQVQITMFPYLTASVVKIHLLMTAWHFQVLSLEYYSLS